MSSDPMKPWYVENCDAGPGAGVYMDRDGKMICRCIICGRCNHHTGNANQGHYWGFCKVTGTIRDFHFCCPDDCELEEN